MAIYDRWGNEVEIIAASEVHAYLTVTVRYSNGEVDTIPGSSLKADGGIAEIDAACAALAQSDSADSSRAGALVGDAPAACQAGFTRSANSINRSAC